MTKRGSAMDDDYIPLSELSQAGYCLRRAALIANEKVWQENADTAKGREEHKNVHTQRIERRGVQVNLYEYEVFSDTLKLRGKCDLIEAVRDASGCRIPAVPFPVRLYPVESKHGKLREEEEYNMQLCAQAMCLEEMYGTTIEEGAIYYVSSHRRQTVQFTKDLRDKVLLTVQTLRQVHSTYVVPPAEKSAKCKRCSLREICMPELPLSAKFYCKSLQEEAIREETL